MKWKQRESPPEPTLGSRKEVVGIAWWPVLCDDKHWRWLERCKWVWEYGYCTEEDTKLVRDSGMIHREHCRIKWRVRRVVAI